MKYKHFDGTPYELDEARVQARYEELKEKHARRRAFKHATLERLCGLTDRHMAREMRNFGRKLRDDVASLYPVSELNDAVSYGPVFLHAVPVEIAKRLGETEFNAEEKRILGFDLLRARQRNLEDKGAEFRIVVSQCLTHQSGANYYGAQLPEGADLTRLKMLDWEVANGNPIAIALDRIYVPSKEEVLAQRRESVHYYDACAATILEIGQRRFGKDFAGTTWSPELSKPRDPEQNGSFKIDFTRISAELAIKHEMEAEYIALHKDDPTPAPELDADEEDSNVIELF